MLFRGQLTYRPPSRHRDLAPLEERCEHPAAISASAWLTHWAASRGERWGPRHTRNAKDWIRLHVAPYWTALSVDDVTREDAIGLLARLNGADEPEQ